MQDDLTPQQAKNGLIELLRPCSVGVTAYFVRLQANKPVYDADPARIAIIYECLYEDLKDYPEAAVVLAFEDLRLTKGKYFPATTDIIEAVTEYQATINECLDFIGNYN